MELVITRTRAFILTLMLTLCAFFCPKVVFGSEKNEGKKNADVVEPIVAEEKATICSMDISYVWIKRDAGLQNISTSQGETVLFSAITLSGDSEVEAKLRVKAEKDAVSRDAMRHCRSIHESRAKCFQGKLQAVQTGYLQASFAVRKLISDSILADCSDLVGSCIRTEASAVNCWQE